ncbi:MAG: hypothetical protein J0H43_15575, partial [Actinobacteria bacterium]|nr:hypothetical protein [Actinomycetota bacterium]
PGAEVTCTAHAKVTQADLDNGQVADTATATGTAPDGTPVPPASGSAVVTAQQQPALALVKTADPTVVTAAGQAVTYSFQVTNTGNVTITGLAITDTLAAPAGPQLRPTCPTTALAPSATTTCTATYTVTQADIDHGTIDNSATAGGTAPSGTPVTSPVSTASVTALPGPLLHLVKKATVTDVDHDGRTDLGDIVAWTFAVTNTGNVTVHGLTIDDPTAGPVTCPVTTLAPGATTTCTAAAHTITQADVDHGSVDNTAVATATDPNGAPVASNPSSTHTPISGRAGLSLVKSGTLSGTTVSWTFLVTNTGTLTLRGVTVSDPKAGVVECPRTTLAPGQAMTCHAARPYTPTPAEQAAGKVTNTATGTGTTPGGTPVTSPTATAVVTLPVPPLASTGIRDLPATIGWGLGMLLVGLLAFGAGATRRRTRRV